MSSESSKMKVVVSYMDRPDDTICATGNTTLGELRSKINSKCSEEKYFNRMWVVFESDAGVYLHFDGKNPNTDKLTLKQVTYGNPYNNEVRVRALSVFQETTEVDQEDEHSPQDTYTLPTPKRTRV